MKKSKVISLIILSIILVSCNKDYKSQIKSEINEFLKNEAIMYDYLVLIPGSGCTGCITNAEFYFIKNVNNPKIKFIFTQITSKKKLELKVGKENLLKTNVFIDTSNRFYLYGYEEKIYPHIMKLFNNKVEEIKQLE